MKVLQQGGSFLIRRGRIRVLIRWEAGSWVWRREGAASFGSHSTLYGALQTARRYVREPFWTDSDLREIDDLIRSYDEIFADESDFPRLFHQMAGSSYPEGVREGLKVTFTPPRGEVTEPRS